MSHKKQIIIFLLAVAFFTPLFSHASFFDFLKLPKFNFFAVDNSNTAAQPKTYVVISLKHLESTNKFMAEGLIFTNQPQFGDLVYTDRYELQELDDSGAVLNKRTFAISHEEYFESFGSGGLSSSFVHVDSATVNVPILFSSGAKKLVIFNQKTKVLEDFSYDISSLVDGYNSFITVSSVLPDYIPGNSITQLPVADVSDRTVELILSAQRGQRGSVQTINNRLTISGGYNMAVALDSLGGENAAEKSFFGKVVPGSYIVPLTFNEGETEASRHIFIKFSGDVPETIDSSFEVNIGSFWGKEDELNEGNNVATYADQIYVPQEPSPRTEPDPDVAGADVSSGLLGWWTFDTIGQVDTASDSSLFKNDGTIIGGASLVTGKIGKALSLDGVNDLVSVPSSQSLKPQNNETIAAWVKTTSPKSFSVTQKGNNYWVRPDKWFFYDGNKLVLSSKTGPDHYPYSKEIKVNDGKWHHVAVTAKDGDNPKFYLDGVYVGDGLSKYYTNFSYYGSYPLLIGASSQSYGGLTLNYFSGAIDDVRIYDRILSDLDILGLYKRVVTNVVEPVQNPVNVVPARKPTTTSSANVVPSVGEEKDVIESDDSLNSFVPLVPEVINELPQINPKPTSSFATTDQDILNLVKSLETAFAPLSAMTVGEFNSSSRVATTDLLGRGSLQVSFPSNSLFSESDCPPPPYKGGGQSQQHGQQEPPPPTTCEGVSGYHPRFFFLVFPTTTANVGEDFVANHPLPKPLNPVFPYIINIAAGAKENTQRYPDILRPQFNVRIALNDLSLNNWKEMALYQFIESPFPSWKKVSDIVQSVNRPTVVEGTPSPQPEGYIFAVLGTKK
ncbi:MAG: LamG domain-containing protein [Candidatus Paceibacterota bacterium]|jgi:hypothetical protein